MSDCERYVSDNDSDFGSYSDEDVNVMGGDDAEETEYIVAPETDDGWRSDDEVAELSDSDDENDKKVTNKKIGKNKAALEITEIEEIDEEALLKEIEELEEEEEEELDISQVSSFNKEIIIVKPENRKTSNVLSKFEITEIVSIRAVQISQFNNCMVDITGLDDPILMAKREIMKRACPILVRRHVGDLKNPVTGILESFYEIWSPNEMSFAVEYLDAV